MKALTQLIFVLPIYVAKILKLLIFLIRELMSGFRNELSIFDNTKMNITGIREVVIYGYIFIVLRMMKNIQL